MPSFLSPILRNTTHDFALINERNQSVVASRLLTAFESSTRISGLLRHQALPAQTALILAPSGAIHTVFMKFPWMWPLSPATAASSKCGTASNRGAFPAAGEALPSSKSQAARRPASALGIVWHPNHLARRFWRVAQLLRRRYSRHEIPVSTDDRYSRSNRNWWP